MIARIRNIGRMSMVALLIAATSGLPTFLHKCAVMGTFSPLQVCEMNHTVSEPDCCPEVTHTGSKTSPAISGPDCCSQVDVTMTIKDAFRIANSDITTDIVALHSVAAPEVMSPEIKLSPIQKDFSPPGDSPAYLLFCTLLI